MLVNYVFNSNPYDKVEAEIKYSFCRKYNILLNRVFYRVFGIIDDCFLCNFLGENELFKIYLGFKQGVFQSVKIMKRPKYFKEQIHKNIKNFQIESLTRQYLKETKEFCDNYFINDLTLYSIDYTKFIIYEKYCVNSSLKDYLNIQITNSNIESIINFVFKEMYYYLSELNTAYGLYVYNLSLDDFLVDENFNVFFNGFQKLRFKENIESNMFLELREENYNDYVSFEELNQNTSLIKVLCELLFGDDFIKIKSYVECFYNSKQYREKESLKKHKSKNSSFNIQNIKEKIDILNSSISIDFIFNNYFETIGKKYVETSKNSSASPKNNLYGNSNCGKDYSLFNDELNSNFDYKMENEFIFNERSKSTSNNNDLELKETHLINNMTIYEKECGNSINANIFDSLSNRNSVIIRSSLDELEIAIESVLSTRTYYNNLNLKQFLLKFITSKSLENLENQDWFCDEYFTKLNFKQEFQLIKNEVLKKRIQMQSNKEIKEYRVKRGIFLTYKVKRDEIKQHELKEISKSEECELISK